MKSLFAIKRSKTIFGFRTIAIGIDAISKKIISYPAGGFRKGHKKKQ